MTKEQLTEQIQKECLDLVNEVMKKSTGNVSIIVQDATNVFLFSKLAEIGLRLRKLEATTVRMLADSNDDTGF